MNETIPIARKKGNGKKEGSEKIKKTKLFLLYGLSQLLLFPVIIHSPFTPFPPPPSPSSPFPYPPPSFPYPSPYLLTSIYFPRLYLHPHLLFHPPPPWPHFLPSLTLPLPSPLPLPRVIWPWLRTQDHDTKLLSYISFLIISFSYLCFSAYISHSCFVFSTFLSFLYFFPL